MLGLPLSVEGLWAAWNILVKATLGVAASVVLAATTTDGRLPAGLGTAAPARGLHVDRGFMIRYPDVIAARGASA